ncbi:MAG TPA: chromosome segregation protein SMC [Candidatus Thermoplasmatota archaeon]|nr:chromosome segregation protein SMC [Candidatus Thermoplasmatota archaeon]
MGCRNQVQSSLHALASGKGCKVYLKEVQMENFKSFGQKLTVPFFPGFTAITGPNGSGKSNIVDAILFVLGPKSSKVMRAGRLTDLIFNGGKKHKNPSKYCKVSLVFDNSSRKMNIESNEVVLTRMIRRAPLKDNPDNYYSYFYINDHAASFSEFEDLLTHARISGEGYNIIKQGDVTNLVEMGSVDRRKIIDDIAGIRTFDEDIEKAQKEREDVDKNLERIDIILNEITTQIRQLKKDRDAAFRYKELKDKLYETKAMIAVKKKQEVEVQIAEVNKQIQSYETEQKKFEEQKEKLRTQYTSLQEKLAEMEKKIGAAGGNEANEIKGKIDALRSESIKVDERINYSNDEITEKKKEQKELESTLNGIEKELEELTTQTNDCTRNLKESEAALKTKENELAALRNEIAQSDDTSMDLTRELVKMREEYTNTQVQKHEAELTRDRLKEKLDSLELQIAELQETQSTYEFELKDVDWQTGEMQKGKQESTKKLKDLEKQLVEKKRAESEVTEQLGDLQNAILKLQREQSKLQAEREATQSVSSKYNSAVNAILGARDVRELKGIRGTIAELAQVEDAYKLPLEIAAGPRMQSIVVTDDAAAAEAITYLQKKKLGRATFLPINKMIVGKPRAQSLMAVKDESSKGFAIDLVKFDADYRGAFWYVFGDTIIVETLTDARRLMGGVRLVDIKGDLIEASGAMVGGSQPSEHLSFGAADQRSLDEITRKLEAAIQNQDALSERLTTLKKEIGEIEDALRTLKGEGEATLQHKDLELRKKEFAGKLELLMNDLRTKAKEKEAIAFESTQALGSIEAFEKRLRELDALKEEKGKHLLKSTKKEVAQQVRALEKTVSELQEATLRLQSEQETVRKKMELLEERKTELSGKITTIGVQIEALKKTVQELKETRGKHQNELKALMTVEETMSGKVKELAGERDALYKKTVGIEGELETISTKVESYLDLVARAKYRLPTLEDSLKEMDRELALYNVDITTTKLPPIESMKEAILSIEQTMQGLEPVNMRALEEYEHQAERKKKFDEDIKHLNEQKKNLVSVVEEITSKKKERFFEVFDEVNKNFKEIYGQLSEGGEAELLLENEENVFEGGLTIKARPHGKKVLRLAALSGGEKSIASLGFIFAIQQYDPSPFYVLDEIDMFLDGVNAEMVSRMIKRRAENSQFISVSLRKIALKEANYLYGVTMHDSGISEMIGNIDPDSVGPKGEISLPQQEVAGVGIGQ